MFIFNFQLNDFFFTFLPLCRVCVCSNFDEMNFAYFDIWHCTDTKPHKRECHRKLQICRFLLTMLVTGCMCRSNFV